MTEREDSLNWFRHYKRNGGKILSNSDEYGEEVFKMELAEAKKLAEDIRNKLKPYCERIEIAGSIRRERMTVNDIEIVCIPKTVTVQDTFFDTKLEKHPGFIKIVDSWERINGDAVEGKYMQRMLSSNIKLDIFTTTRYNWGLIYAIRTGSADFSYKVLACGWKKKGYHSLNGILRTEASRIQVAEEEDLFKLIGIGWIPPKEREV